MLDPKTELLIFLIVLTVFLLTKLIPILKVKIQDLSCCFRRTTLSDEEEKPKKKDWPGNKELSDMFLKSYDYWDLRWKVHDSIDYETRTVEWNEPGSRIWKMRSAAMMAMWKKDLWKFFPSRSCKTMIDWNFRDHDYNTAPMLAVIQNDVECVRMLSKIEGIDWNRHNIGRWPRIGLHDNDSIHDIADYEQCFDCP